MLEFFSTVTYASCPGFAQGLVPGKANLLSTAASQVQESGRVGISRHLSDFFASVDFVTSWNGVASSLGSGTFDLSHEYQKKGL